MEYEVKLAGMSSETLDAILRDAQIGQAMAETVRSIPMETTYYDTADGSLGAKRWTLRRRMEGGTPVVTLKTPAPQKDCRNEWETECEDVRKGIPALIELGAPAELSQVCELVPVCGAKFLRRAVLLSLEGCEAELALDEGILFRGDRRTELREAELELKGGDPAAMLALAERLCRDFGLYEEKKSKFYRASLL
ncbi:MAG: CYTH domain-containing protein [Oscillospiraceae bacterium]|nr:CYTH domain-containing protein [Oscillospiraceae bacterium]